MLLFKSLLLIIFITFSHIVFAQNEQNVFYSDWRLDRPFVAGLVTGLTFGYQTLKPASFQVADKLQHYSVASGLVEILYQQTLFSRYLGVFFGVLFWIYFLGSFLYRYVLIKKNSDGKAIDCATA
jgi:hypothetical protein